MNARERAAHAVQSHIGFAARPWGPEAHKTPNSICMTVWATREQTANHQPGRSFWSKGMGTGLRLRLLGTGEKEGEAEAVSIY